MYNDVIIKSIEKFNIYYENEEVDFHDFEKSLLNVFLNEEGNTNIYICPKENVYFKEEFKSAGYNIDYKVLNAKEFGVLEDRKRIILIGWRENINFKYPQFKAMENKYTIKDLFSDLPFIKSGECFNSYRTECTKCLEDIHIRTKDWNVLTQNTSRPNNQRDLEIYKLYIKVWKEEGRKLKYNELPEHLSTHSNKNSFLDRFNIVPYDDICHTVVAHIAKDGHYYIHPDISQNRSLTVREAARIQSFPDDYYFESSRTAAFKQIGNAVPPLMAEVIAKYIKKELASSNIQVSL